MALVEGATFGAYRIIGRLGRGGMATVYRAYEPGLDRYVALKVLPEDSLADDTAMRRFELEARAVARLIHPNIVPVHAYGIDAASRTPWMALQLVEGGSLASLLARERVTPGRALKLLRGMGTALDYAHSMGILHRDVKPQNVLLAPGDHVYLADFGLARMFETSAVLSAAGAVMGTPQYMSPEQASGLPVDSRTDIYAVGIVAYEMFVGAPPFQADTPMAVLMKHIRDPIPIPPTDELAGPLLAPVLKALAKNREDRWASAGAFVEALDIALRDVGHAPARGLRTISLAGWATPTVTDEGERSKPRISRGWFAGATIAVVGAVAAMVISGALVKVPGPSQPTTATLAVTPPMPSLTPIAPGSTAPAPSRKPAARPSESSPDERPTARRSAPTSADVAHTDHQTGPPGHEGDAPPAILGLRRLCEGGDSRACAQLGLAYTGGNGVDVDLAEAFRWFGAGCKKGSQAACVLVGAHYADGVVVAKDAGRALKLFEDACGHGEALGCNSAGLLYEVGNGTGADLGRAAGLYRRACDGGAPYGCANLARLHMTGQGVPQDTGAAVSLLGRACGAGVADACQQLKALTPFSGSYVGTATDTLGGEGVFRATVRQEGDRLVGTWQATWPQVNQDSGGQLEAAINGSAISGTLSSSVPGMCPLQFVGALAAETLSGTYSSVAPCPAVVTGSFRAARR